MTREEYLNQLLSIVSKQRHSLSYGALTTLLNSPSSLTNSLDELHDAIKQIFNQRVSRWALVTRWKNNRQHANLHETSLQTELKAAMNRAATEALASATHVNTSQEAAGSSRHSSNRSTQLMTELPSYYTPEEFNSEIVFAHVLYAKSGNQSPCDEYLIRHALIELSNHYKKQYDQKAAASNPTAVKFYNLRLATLKAWTTTTGYATLIQSIHQFQQIFQKQERDENHAFSFFINKNALTNDAIEPLLERLNWLEVIADSDALMISESPAAMRLALRIIGLTEHPLEEQQSNYINLIHHFKWFFFGTEGATVLGRDCVAGINIDAPNQNSLLNQIDVLDKAYESKNWENVQRALGEVRDALINVYNELAGLLKQNSWSNIEKFNVLLAKIDPEKEIQFVQYSRDALAFRALALASKEKRTTGSSDEPLILSTEKRLSFTPHEWVALENPSKSSRRSSGRSRSPASSGRNSMLVHSQSSQGLHTQSEDSAHMSGESSKRKAALQGKNRTGTS